MFESWDEMIEAVGRRPGMYVGRDRYSLVRSYVEGFGAGRRDEVLKRFQTWLSGQTQHRAVNNYVWSALVLREVFPPGAKSHLAHLADPPMRTDWPMPPLKSPGEEDLDHPEDDRVAIAHLFARLREFLDLDGQAG